VDELGRYWKAIQPFFPGRTNVNIKNRWDQLRKKGPASQGAVTPVAGVPKDDDLDLWTLGWDQMQRRAHRPLYRRHGARHQTSIRGNDKAPKARGRISAARGGTRCRGLTHSVDGRVAAPRRLSSTDSPIPFLGQREWAKRMCALRKTKSAVPGRGLERCALQARLLESAPAIRVRSVDDRRETDARLTRDRRGPPGPRGVAWSPRSPRTGDPCAASSEGASGRPIRLPFRLPFRPERSPGGRAQKHALQAHRLHGEHVHLRDLVRRARPVQPQPQQLDRQLRRL